jgi:hypothetical protein
MRLHRFFYHEEEACANAFFYHEEACANAFYMSEEILDTEDDNACVKISNFIPF